MAKEELFDVISFRVKEGKRGTTIVHTLDPVPMEEAEKIAERLKEPRFGYENVTIVEDMGLE